MKTLDLNDYLYGNLDGYNINFDKLLEDFPILEETKNCEQNPQYHSEGSVWEHIQMTLKALIVTKEWGDLDDKEKTILFMSGVFHDIGKIRCTKEEDGKIVTKKHSVIGARIARNLLWDWDLRSIKITTTTTWEIREAVSNMVLLHMLPIHIFDKKDPLYSICASSMVIKNSWLNLLAKADNFGRICKSEQDFKNALDGIELHKMFCHENLCWDSKKEFKSDYAKFKYFFERKGHPDFDRFEKPKGTVVIMSGIQGSGKSFTINKLYGNLPIVGFDETRFDMEIDYGKDEGSVIRNTKEQCKVLMREQKDFVFNATNTIKDIRGKWIRLFRDYGYKVIIHYIERPLQVTLKANRDRANIIPEFTICEKFLHLDVPTELECHELILSV
jgi:predicted kinase